MTTSVLIPTYQRADMIKQAIESCLNQTRLPDEILISDDSPGTETAQLITKVYKNSKVVIKYYHNKPALRQVENVNSLFHKVQTELLVLLHDDDILLPNAIEDLHNCFVKNPEIDAAYGKQYVMDNNGALVYDNSESVNRAFYRSKEYEGSVLSPLEAGMVAQFPNDAYMLRSAVAKKLLYTTDSLDACDYDFSLRLGVHGAKMFFFNGYTAAYRIALDSISNHADNNAALTSFQLLEAVDVPTTSLKFKNTRLANMAPVAIVQAATLGQCKKALSIYFSEWHRSKIFSLGGARRLYLITKSYVKNTFKS